MQAAARDHIRDRCIQLDQHARSRQEALRNLHSQWQSILDFRQLVVSEFDIMWQHFPHVSKYICYYLGKYSLDDLVMCAVNCLKINILIWQTFMNFMKMQMCIISWSISPTYIIKHVLLLRLSRFSDRIRSEVWLRGIQRPRPSWSVCTQRCRCSSSMK